MRLLLKCDADIEAAAYNGKRALHLAVEMGQVEIVDILLVAGANMDAGANDGRTPLTFALHNDRGLAMIASLLDRGAKLEATSDNGRTALH